MSDLWTFDRARVTHVVDGDTVDAEIDLGFRTVKTVRLRLMGVDTAEIYGTEKGSDEYQRGIEQTRFVREWVDDHDSSTWPLTVRTDTDSGIYGRWPARIQADDKTVLNDAIIAEWPDAASDYET